MLCLIINLINFHIFHVLALATLSFYSTQKSNLQTSAGIITAKNLNDCVLYHKLCKPIEYCINFFFLKREYVLKFNKFSGIFKTCFPRRVYVLNPVFSKFSGIFKSCFLRRTCVLNPVFSNFSGIFKTCFLRVQYGPS